ncbi:hypothetical protein CTAYLR_003829 [Chrysophaeum taylorii]|uniref:shikimate kinase n=1 Tax=Chrysophaeum taylorii TaxID=2483200 RepID=A0AAD7UDI4_9STRA|nr:hypothetical protein CTAYLR_003829 [Chrysophaeum taylorii]
MVMLILVGAAVSFEVSPGVPRAGVSVRASEQGRLLAERMRGVNLYLVGVMGSGKSVVGDSVCRKLGSYAFVDTDAMVESAMKKSIPEIFAEGEEYFRDAETAVLGQVSPYVRLVVATGGGIVLRKSNWASLQTGLVVFLDPDEEILEARLSANPGDRPLLRDTSDVASILAARRSLYEQADVRVAVDDPGETPDQTADRLIQAVLRFIADNPPKQPPS